MDKYVHIEDLKCYLNRQIQTFESCPDKYDAVIWIYTGLYQIPAAEVTSVRHGRWEKVTSLMHQFGYYLGASCSICGKTHYFLSGEIISNYCPNCGAKMDGDIVGKRT